MKMKKILSAILAGTMLFSSIAFSAENTSNSATDENTAITLPQFKYDVFEGEELLISADTMTSGAMTNLRLDAGMVFSAVEDYDTADVAPYRDWIVDYEIKFSEDTTAQLAGWYENGNNGKWLTLENFDFEGGKTYKVMEESGLDELFTNTYINVVNWVREFKCGVVCDKATTSEDTVVTLSLCITDPKTEQKYTLGSFDFDYSVTLPEYNMTELEGDELVVEADGLTSSATNEYTLDYGMVFSAVEDYDTADVAPYRDWIVDYEIEFSKDSTAQLLGWYENGNNNKWLSLGSFDFEGGKTYKIMEESGLDQLFHNSYINIVNWVNVFKCGVVFDAIPFETDVTLRLCMTDNYTGEKYVVGEYTKTTGALKETTDTDEKIAENINSLKQTDVAVNAEEIKTVISELNQESKDSISADVIKTLVEDQIDEEATEPAAYTTDSTITVDVEEPDANDVVPAALNGSDAFDIVVKENGVETDTVDVPVLIAIPVEPDAVIEKVVHIHNGVVKEITNFVRKGNMLYIQMSEFSYIGIFYAVTPVAGEAVLNLVPVEESDARYEEGKAKFDIVLEGDTVDTIKNFVAGEFTVSINGNSASFDYDVAVNNPTETTIGYNLVDANTRDYRVYLRGCAVGSGVITGFENGVSWTSLITEKEMVLGTLTISTYGTGSVQLTDVLMVKHDGSDENLAVEIPTTPCNAKAFTVPVPQRELTVNVVFNNKIENVDPLYNDMCITISGDDLAQDIVFPIGKDVQGVEFDEANCTYTVKANLTKDREYNVTVTGEGYRTARYDVNMRDKNRTLTFWNNAKNDAVAQEVEVDEDGTKFGTKVTTNFLAGDIIKDNIINIYDLSAVVSYFGEEGLSASNNDKYVMYDLNRDGKIDSKDVAYVLVSWGR